MVVKIANRSGSSNEQQVPVQKRTVHPTSSLIHRPSFDQRSTKHRIIMNTKVLVAALVGGVVAFLLGWVIFGMALMGYYEANMIHYEGLMKGEGEMNLILLLCSNFVLSLLLAYAAHRMGVSDLKGGLVTGAILGGLFFLSLDLSFLAMMNFFASTTMVVVDVLANTIWSACIGAAIGFMLGRGRG